MTHEPAPIAVDEHVAAKALGLSVFFLRKDRQTNRRIPFYKIGSACRYNLDRCREALAAMEQGGPSSSRVSRAGARP
jgi:hypothetical protein